MNVFPAIDVLDGKAVRLRKGDRSTAEVVGDPLDLARKFADAGAPMVHLVDLNGAFGEKRQLSLVPNIARIVPVQAGGGVRSKDALSFLLDAGASKIVVGTWAFKDPEGFAKAAKDAASKIVVAADVDQYGQVAISGWTETHPETVGTAIKALRDTGIRTFLVTAIERDGTMEGPLLGLYLMLHRALFGMRIIASGGVKSISDLAVLQNMNLHGVVVGKALYNGAIRLEDVKWT